MAETDLISRQAAIALAKDIIVPTKDGSTYKHRCIDPDEIRKLPSAQPEQRWTLCRDKKPAEELNCWFTANNCNGYRYVGHGMFTSRYGRQMEKGFITTSGYFVRWKSVLAWMPIVIPEPWEGECDG